MWDSMRRMSIRVLAGLGLSMMVFGVAWGAPPKPEATFDSVPVTAADKVLGRADAPVTIVEYASFTCGHCAQFHADIVPELKKAYIDTGKVRLVFRDFPLDRHAFAASIVARCSAGDRYFGFVDLLFREQPRWAGTQNPFAALSGLALLGGISKKKLDACFKDEKLQNAVLQQRLTGSKKFKVNSTPTVIVNGAKYRGDVTLEQLRAVIEAILSRS